MHARVVRFTGVTPERLAAVVARVEESEGPRPECLRKTETPASGLAGVSDIERDVRMGGPIHFIGCLGL